MNAPLTFDFWNDSETPPRISYKIVDPYSRPKARVSDPSTSHEAAATVKPSRKALVAAIRVVLAPSPVPLSAFDIARGVNELAPNRWDEGSIRTAVSAAGLRAVDTEGRSPRGQRCIRYSL